MIVKWPYEATLEQWCIIDMKPQSFKQHAANSEFKITDRAVNLNDHRIQRKDEVFLGGTGRYNSYGANSTLTWLVGCWRNVPLIFLIRRVAVPWHNNAIRAYEFSLFGKTDASSRSLLCGNVSSSFILLKYFFCNCWSMDRTQTLKMPLKMQHSTTERQEGQQLWHGYKSRKTFLVPKNW